MPQDTMSLWRGRKRERVYKIVDRRFLKLFFFWGFSGSGVVEEEGPRVVFFVESCYFKRNYLT